MAWENLYFRYLSLSVNVGHGDVSTDAPAKGTTLYVDESTLTL